MDGKSFRIQAANQLNRLSFGASGVEAGDGESHGDWHAIPLSKASASWTQRFCNFEPVFDGSAVTKKM
jgi:hypothetical protein